MKFLIVVVLSLAVASGFTLHQNEVEPIGRVRNLIDAALAYAFQFKTDPFIQPDGPLFDSGILVTNGQLCGLSHLIFDQEATDEKALNATFRVALPEVTIEFDYELHESLFGSPISGNGHFKLVATNLSFVVNEIEFSESRYNKQIQVELVDSDFYMDDLTVKMGDLKVNGETASDVGKLIETLFHFFYHLERKEFSRRMSSEIRHQLNGVLYERTMEEATQWLKNHTK